MKKQPKSTTYKRLVFAAFIAIIILTAITVVLLILSPSSTPFYSNVVKQLNR